MAGRYRTGQRLHSRRSDAKNRSGGVAVAATAVGAFLALGMTPLATAPEARADIDDFFQPIITALEQAVSTVDPSLFGSADPGLDLDSLLAPALAAGSVDPSASLDSLLTGWAQTLIYDPIQELDQAWIASPLGEQSTGCHCTNGSL